MAGRWFPFTIIGCVLSGALAAAVGCAQATNPAPADSDDDDDVVVTKPRGDDDDARDAGFDANDGAPPPCSPAPSDGFPGGPYQPPSGKHQGKCSGFQIAKYVDCRTGNKVACNELEAENDGGASCLACIESREADPKWGPIVLGDHAFEESTNESGCAALVVGDTGKAGCGKKIADYTECLHFTCDEVCLGTSYFGCANEARTTVCAAFTDTAQTACGGADVSLCFAQDGDGPYDLVTRVMTLFCGPP